MKIEQTSKKKNIGFVVASLAILFLFVCLFTFFNLNPKEEKIEQTKPIEGRNYLKTTGLDVQQLIKDKRHLYDDKDVSVFALKDPYGSKIVFAYKDLPTGRLKDDKFFIHVFPKDSTLISTPFINYTFTSNNDFDKQTLNGLDYYLLEKILLSSIYDENHIPFDSIKHINFGRFNSELGRSLSLKGIKISNEKIINFNTQVVLPENSKSERYNVNKLDLFTSKKSYDKLKLKRDKALDVGVLLTNEDDIVKGDLSVNGGEKIKVDFRLKGDWTDHLNEKNKWSYRVIAKGDETILGMRKISIQHPKSRNFQWEWLFNKIIKDEGIIGLRYDFILFNLQIKGQGTINNGIMALEESFDKILIENNKKREGIILGFDEDLIWQDRYRQKELGLEESARDFDVLGDIAYAKVKVYNEGKVLKDPKLLRQLNVAKDLLESLKQGKQKVSEVFDLDKLTTFVALSNLFGGDHGLIWHNLRIYYNPITNKLEPISFDNNAGRKKTKVIHYPFTEGDTLYSKALAKKLAKYSTQEYIDKIFINHGGQLNTITKLLKKGYSNVSFEAKILEYNSNFIKKYIYPNKTLTTDFVSQSNNELVLDINNVTNFPLEISGIYHNDGQKLNMSNEPLIVNNLEKTRVLFKLNPSFNNAFVSKKNKKGGFQYPNDIADLRIEAQIIGTNYLKKYGINSFGANQDINTSVVRYRNLNSTNYKNIPFIVIDTLKRVITFKSGAYTTSETLNIPAGYLINVESGFELNLINNASLLSKSTIIAKGTKENPIIFTSSDNTGGGLFITDTPKKSIVDHCIFSNLSNPNNDIWEVSGAVNFHESDVTITNSQFRDNSCEDGLNIIRSKFLLQDSQFYNTFSDSFDGDFVTGEIVNCQFFDSGNDGIDVSGSSISLENILIKNPSDKAISAGEASTMSGNNISVEEGEIGIVSKDLSTITFSNVFLKNTRLGFSAFQKKSEYGNASIAANKVTQINIETNYLIERQSSLLIDGIKMPTVSNKVIDQMYGNEYGKSTK